MPDKFKVPLAFKSLELRLERLELGSRYVFKEEMHEQAAWAGVEIDGARGRHKDRFKVVRVSGVYEVDVCVISQGGPPCLL